VLKLTNIKLLRRKKIPALLGLKEIVFIWVNRLVLSIFEKLGVQLVQSPCLVIIAFLPCPAIMETVEPVIARFLRGTLLKNDVGPHHIGVELITLL
jgi:hypothetical protein